MNVFTLVFHYLGSELMYFVTIIAGGAAAAIALKYVIGLVRH